VDRLERDLCRFRDVLSQWPGLYSDLEQARALQAEKENRAILDQFEAAKQIHAEFEAVHASVTNRPYPTDEEIRQVRTAQRDITMLENQLCGMNLQAAIRMLDDHCVEIVSLRTGRPVQADAITEAVRITIPGIMEMQLSPANVDVEAVEDRLAANRQIIDQIFGTYQVSSLQELEQFANTLTEAKRKEEAAHNRMTMLLGSKTFSELQAAANRISCEPRSMEQIETEIRILCGSRDVATFITAKETVAAGYAAEFGSINDLKARVFDLDGELNKAREAMTLAQDIPAEFLAVSDPDAHLEQLQRTLKQKQNLRETALTAKTTAVSRLESRREQSDGDPVAELERANRNFMQQKELLHHWLHIAEVFRSLQQELRSNPMQGLADRFGHYLSLISCDGVTSEFPDGEKLNVSIFSRDDKLLDYGKLSEGTKESVSLAFRLAVLDHLFPDGGVIVLDDPFTDMDADRTAQACRLIADCAQRHQVIFLTCREDYLTALGGNTIYF
jgi:hypothetical protein